MKKTKKPKKTTRSKIEKELDNAWSKYVRGRDKYCQMCGGNSTLAAHHAFSRRHRATRWDVYCGVSVCWPCHQFRAHGDPAGFTVWFRKHVGDAQFERLSECHRQITKFTTDDLERMLKDIISLSVNLAAALKISSTKAS